MVSPSMVETENIGATGDMPTVAVGVTGERVIVEVGDGESEQADELAMANAVNITINKFRRIGIT